MDLNGDGKHDWKDDLIAHDLMENSNQPKQEPTYQNPHGNRTGAIWTIIAAAYAGAVISGSLPINMFTGLTALAAAGWVVFFLFCEWLEH